MQLKYKGLTKLMQDFFNISKNKGLGKLQKPQKKPNQSSDYRMKPLVYIV